MSYETVLLPKWLSHQGRILAKEQFHNSYTIWAMPILIFSPVQIIMTHPLGKLKRLRDFSFQLCDIGRLSALSLFGSKQSQISWMWNSFADCSVFAWVWSDTLTASETKWSPNVVKKFFRILCDPVYHWNFGIFQPRFAETFWTWKISGRK